MRIPSGTTDQYIYFYAVDATDFTTPETGLSSFTVYRSRNGAAAAAFTTPTINETDSSNMAGVYELLLDEDMTIDAGDDEQEMVFHISHAGMAPVVRTITLFRPKITAGYTLGVESDGDLTKVNTLDGHTAQTGDSYAIVNGVGGISDINTDVEAILADTGTDGVVIAAAQTVATVTDLTNLPTIPANWLTAAGTAADFTTEIQSGLATSTELGDGTVVAASVTGAVGSVTGAVGSVTAGVTLANGAHGGAAASITLADYSDFTGAAAANPNVLQSGTITVTDQTHFTLNAGSADDDAYLNMVVVLEDSATATQKSVRTITAYTGSTKTVTIDSAPDFNIANTDNFDILAVAPGSTPPTASVIADAVWDEVTSGHTTPGTSGQALIDVLADTNELQADDYPTTLATLATAAELAKVPKSDGTASWNATALAAINAEADTAISDASLATAAELAKVPKSDGTTSWNATALAAINAEADTAIADASLATAAALTTMQGNVTDILADTNELQTDDIPTTLATLATSAELADGTVQVGTVQDGAIGAAAVADIFSTTNIAEAYTTDTQAGTPAQILYEILQSLTEFSITGTTLTVKQRDGSTATTYTLDSDTVPTLRNRTT